MLTPILIALAALATAPAPALNAGPPSQAPVELRCTAWVSQTCDFAIYGESGRPVRYELAAGAVQDLPSSLAGRAYGMGVNVPPPEDLAQCSRSPTPEAKRSRWCRAGVIRPGGNG